MTEKGSYPISVDINNYSYFNYMVSILKQWSSPTTFDPFPKVQVIREYIIAHVYINLWEISHHELWPVGSVLQIANLRVLPI